MLLTAGLDYYKLTMSQLAYEKYPNLQVTFKLHNRGTLNLMAFCPVAKLQEALDEIAEKGFTSSEIIRLADDHRLSVDYLDYIQDAVLPPVQVTEKNGDLDVTVTGPWPLVTFWETVVMSQINEIYFSNLIKTQNRTEIYREGRDRLIKKAELLKEAPGLKLIEFGTRRRFSFNWQAEVTNYLANQTPNLVGTSNVYLADSLGIPVVGTFAHEMPMIYAGMTNYEDHLRWSHSRMLSDWYNFYGEELSIALTDTWGADFFFHDFTKEQAKLWKGLRHDSGDPFTFGERAIQFYQENDVDPKEKTIVFSDGLDIPLALELFNRFNGRIKTSFGIGTNLTNDLGLTPLNIVMKAVKVDDKWTVKLSDNEGKHLGPLLQVAYYKQVFDYKPLGAVA